jgi:hypothetical protein
MPRDAFIVIGEQTLYTYLCETFRRRDDVQVILERRSADRRRQSGDARAPERRHGDRRVRPHIDVRSLGVAMVRVRASDAG